MLTASCLTIVLLLTPNLRQLTPTSAYNISWAPNDGSTLYDALLIQGNYTRGRKYKLCSARTIGGSGVVHHKALFVQHQMWSKPLLSSTKRSSKIKQRSAIWATRHQPKSYLRPAYVQLTPTAPSFF